MLRVSNADLCSKFVDEIYLPKLLPRKAEIPEKLRNIFADLSLLK